VAVSTMTATVSRCPRNRWNSPGPDEEPKIDEPRVGRRWWRRGFLYMSQLTPNLQI
jgi:hypothetical protein